MAGWRCTHTLPWGYPALGFYQHTKDVPTGKLIVTVIWPECRCMAGESVRWKMFNGMREDKLKYNTECRLELVMACVDVADLFLCGMAPL